MEGLGRVIDVAARENGKVNIDHNYFYNRVKGTEETGYEVIRLGISSQQDLNTGHVVEHNLFQECNGELELISVKCSNTKIRFNTIVESAGFITLRHGNHHNVVRFVESISI